MMKSDVVLFMKGTPETPRCGFSRQIVAILQDRKVNFTTFDILTDEDVRQGESLFVSYVNAREIYLNDVFVGLKVLNNWPTFPQLIVKGELVGGLDIVKEMDEAEFAEMFGAYTAQ